MSISAHSKDAEDTSGSPGGGSGEWQCGWSHPQSSGPEVPEDSVALGPAPPTPRKPKRFPKRAKEVMNPRMLALGEALDPRGANPLHWALESEAQNY